MRAELLVLRKWPAAWGLLLVTPALVLLNDYVAQFISYLSLTPNRRDLRLCYSLLGVRSLARVPHPRPVCRRLAGHPRPDHQAA
jgi:hypothetical protein